MNRNTWIIIIVAVIVIIGLIWIFNRGPTMTESARTLADPSAPPYDKCLASYPKAYDYCASKAEGAF